MASLFGPTPSICFKAPYLEPIPAAKTNNVGFIFIEVEIQNLEFASTIGYDNVIDFGLVAEFGSELFFCSGDEFIIEFFFD